ncbi:hypothetical protein L484_027800 [Morus notabilis]|uniref:Uncharacterized protein n=1 Tax=Morus notabilis TaxID=981085 RepID=W9RNG6_9ROSA|nr:uncharacterized protein LOC21410408 [Morus notabilis]EXB82621.1 hypothetical protein L484_027800 [Morus notabilis]
MESNKLKASGILKKALTVFTKNTNFIIFTSLVSLPFFCFSLYFETSLQNFLLQTSAFLLQGKDHETPEREFLQFGNGSYVITLHSYFEHHETNWSLPLDIVRKLNSDLFRELLQLGFLYLVPFHLLELLTVLVIVDFASKIYREDKSFTFNDMLDVKTDGARLRGILITYGYVVLLSTCTLFGFIWLLATYSSALRYYDSDNGFILRSYLLGRGSDVFFHLVYGANLLLLIGIYLVWSAIWNLGLVVSLLKGTYGAKALGSSAYLSLRNAHNGVILMLVFSVWGVGLRLIPCLVFGGYKTWGWIVAQTSLFCFGNALKWVSFVVYFDDCIKRIFGKKVDAEEGKELRGQNSS